MSRQHEHVIRLKQRPLRQAPCCSSISVLNIGTTKRARAALTSSFNQNTLMARSSVTLFSTGDIIEIVVPRIEFHYFLYDQIAYGAIVGDAGSKEVPEGRRQGICE